MAAREVVKLISDACRADLQTYINALGVVSGDTRPTISEFRDSFSHDSLDPMNWPAVVVDIEQSTVGAGELKTQSSIDLVVPIEIAYFTHDLDTSAARAKASYALRGLTRLLSALVGQTENGVMLMQITEMTIQFFVYSDRKFLGASVRALAQARDQEFL